MKSDPKNNGGDTDYYHTPPCVTLNDLIEHKNMGFAQGNIFKAAYRLGEKDGVTQLYDLYKMRYYVDRMIKQLESNGQDK